MPSSISRKVRPRHSTLLWGSPPSSLEDVSSASLSSRLNVMPPWLHLNLRLPLSLRRHYASCVKSTMPIWSFYRAATFVSVRSTRSPWKRRPPSLCALAANRPWPQPTESSSTTDVLLSVLLKYIGSTSTQHALSDTNVVLCIWHCALAQSRFNIKTWCLIVHCVALA
jgi:hypothetical protein